MGKPIFFSLQHGELGRFERFERVNINSDTATVYFWPFVRRDGFSLFPQLEAIHNVPISGLTHVFHPPSKKNGVCPDGYIFMTHGEFGNNWLGNEIKLVVDKKINELTSEIKRVKIQSGYLESQNRSLSTPGREQLREKAEIDQIITQKGNKKNESEYPGMDDTI